MALISHACTICGHPDFWRLEHRNQPQCPMASCTCLRCTPGPPAVRSTYDQAGQKVERIIKPGDVLHLGVPTCGCAKCKALYEQLTAA
ncbi:hypothetical protein [Pseudonocardia sp.]|uniref:hypothetical protein n=1 Tax=Pseudonocardia sp. TaxID=60912 RepID=UPI0026394C7D|nr:hypothetical protein [Pseudonocardia sp.]MCW2720493.1 hypothetical protein [Pseudonocardia sp.]